MDLSTTYLGMKLANPLISGASPLVDDLDTVKRLEDAGVAAIVMHSLFEEQITGERTAASHYMYDYADSHAEAGSYFPQQDEYALGPDRYLEQIARLKQSVKVPVVASLNGATPGGWTDYARLMQQAGADALELNVYFAAMDIFETGQAVEQRVLDVAAIVKRSVSIPVAVKLSPFFSSIPNLASKLNDLGVDGLVLFNRFYQPDIDLDMLEATPKLHLSDSSELLLRLRWIALLAGEVNASLIVTGGVHTSHDALKAVMVGADGVQVVSALLRHGPGYLRILLEGMQQWLEVHEYESLRQLRGSMSLRRCPNPRAFERGNYLRILQSWHPASGAVP